MSNANGTVSRYGNVMIIAVAVVVIAVIFLYFMDRQADRQRELQRFDRKKVDIWQNWEVPQQNARWQNMPLRQNVPQQQNVQPNNYIPGSEGTVL